MSGASYGAAPFESVPTEVIGGAIAWLSSTATGTLATALCVIAIAAIGLMMLAGRVPVLEGLRVVLGCFVLLGAPAIAAALLGLGQASVGAVDRLPPPAPTQDGNPPDLRAAELSTLASPEVR